MTYTEYLKLLYKLDFTPDLSRVAGKPAELLRWALTSVLLDKPVEAGVDWLNRQLKQTSAENNILERFLNFVNIGTVEKLFGEQNNQNLINAIDLLPTVINEPMFKTKRAIIKEMAIGLYLATDNEIEMKNWREKRLSQQVYEGWEASAFEVLYLSGEQVLSDSFNNLVDAGTRVSINTLYDRNLNSVAPLVLALVGHSKREKVSLVEKLKGRIFSLNDSVFGNDGTFINFDEPVWELIRKDMGNLIYQISQQITGKGKLSTGSYEFAAFTTNLAPILTKKLKKRTDLKLIENIKIESILRLSESVEINNVQLKSLESRISVAIEQTKHYLEILDKNVGNETKSVKL